MCEDGWDSNAADSREAGQELARIHPSAPCTMSSRGRFVVQNTQACIWQHVAVCGMCIHNQSQHMLPDSALVVRALPSQVLHEACAFVDHSPALNATGVI